MRFYNLYIRKTLNIILLGVYVLISLHTLYHNHGEDILWKGSIVDRSEPCSEDVFHKIFKETGFCLIQQFSISQIKISDGIEEFSVYFDEPILRNLSVNFFYKPGTDNYASGLRAPPEFLFS